MAVRNVFEKVSTTLTRNSNSLNQDKNTHNFSTSLPRREITATIEPGFREIARCSTSSLAEPCTILIDAILHTPAGRHRMGAKKLLGSSRRWQCSTAGGLCKLQGALLEGNCMNSGTAGNYLPVQAREHCQKYRVGWV